MVKLVSLGALFPRIFGLLRNRCFSGRRKVGDMHIFFVAVDAFRHCLLCLQNFALASALGEAGDSFFAFSAVLVDSAFLINSRVVVVVEPQLRGPPFQQQAARGLANDT